MKVAVEICCLGLTSRAFLPHALCSRWRWQTDLPYQPEAHSVAASFASRKQIARPQQGIVRLPMRVVDHLINSALAAERTRKKIVSGTGAFHKDLQLEPAASRGWARANGGSGKLDDGLAVTVARRQWFSSAAGDR